MPENYKNQSETVGITLKIIFPVTGNSSEKQSVIKYSAINRLRLAVYWPSAKLQN
jgi:hypothetical protein